MAKSLGVLVQHDREHDHRAFGRLGVGTENQRTTKVISRRVHKKGMKVDARQARDAMETFGRF